MTEELKTESVEEQTEQVDTQKEETTEKTFTQAELDKIVQDRVARAESKKDKEYQVKMDEAEKLRKMNAEQKAQYEKEQSEARIKELEAQIARNGLEKQASLELAEKGITTNEEILNFVVRETAEATQEAINVLVKLVDEQADAKVKELMKGKTPTKVANTTQGLTKEQFNKLSYRAKLDLFKKDPELYNELKG